MKVFAIALALTACGSAHDGGDNVGDGAGSDGGGGGTADSGTGGGGGSTGPFVAKSGERIKMRVLTTPDGAKQFNGWHDTELDVDCSFREASDGQERCLPSVPGAWAVIFYENDTCTTPLGYTIATCPPETFGSYVTMSGSSGDQCSPTYRTRVYDGATIYEGTLYVKSGTSCVVSASTAYHYYSLGPEVPASTFQSGTVAIE